MVKWWEFCLLFSQCIVCVCVCVRVCIAALVRAQHLIWQQQQQIKLKICAIHVESVSMCYYPLSSTISLLLSVYVSILKCLCYFVITIAHDLHTHFALLSYYIQMSKNIHEPTKCKIPLWIACMQMVGFCCCFFYPALFTQTYNVNMIRIIVFVQAQQRNGNQIKLKTLIQ